MPQAVLRHVVRLALILCSLLAGPAFAQTTSEMLLRLPGAVALTPNLIQVGYLSFVINNGVATQVLGSSAMSRQISGFAVLPSLKQDAKAGALLTPDMFIWQTLLVAQDNGRTFLCNVGECRLNEKQLPAESGQQVIDLSRLDAGQLAALGLNHDAASSTPAVDVYKVAAGTLILVVDKAQGSGQVFMQSRELTAAAQAGAVIVPEAPSAEQMANWSTRNQQQVAINSMNGLHESLVVQIEFDGSSSTVTQKLVAKDLLFFNAYQATAFNEADVVAQVARARSKLVKLPDLYRKPPDVVMAAVRQAVATLPDATPAELAAATRYLDLIGVAKANLGPYASIEFKAPSGERYTITRLSSEIDMSVVGLQRDAIYKIENLDFKDTSGRVGNTTSSYNESLRFVEVSEGALRYATFYGKKVDADAIKATGDRIQGRSYSSYEKLGSFAAAMPSMTCGIVGAKTAPF